jgi:hypothetical protein
MKRLHNGSLLSNLLLVAGGALAGSVLTWSLTTRPSHPATIPGADSTASGTMPPPARSGALIPRAGDDALKLSQIMAADDPDHKAEDLNRLGREVATGDPEEALALAENIDGEADRVVFVRGAFEAWAARDPRAAAAYANTHFPAGELRSETIRVSVAQWARTDPRAAFEWMEASLSGPLKEEALVALAQGWSQRSPAQAAGWFVETGSTSQPLLSAIAGTWARQDPAAAIQWASGLNDQASRGVGLTSALGELARQDPSAAAAAAAPFLDAGGPGGAAAAVPDLATVLADIWGNADPSAAASWVRRLPPGASQVEAAATLATVWAASDISAAVAWSDTIADPPLKAAVIANLGTSWGAIEPDRALAWLDSLPAGTALRGTMGALNSWAATDPIGLGDWISQLAPGARNDLARRSLGDVLADQDPMAALELATGMADPVQQSDAVARYYRQLHRTDPASASAWLLSEGSRLPAPAQESLSREDQRLRQKAARIAR